MGAKEKAVELRDKFAYHADWNNEYGSAEKQANLKHAKECALIAVNEILDLGYDSKGDSFRVYQFYSNVKLEILKL